MARKISMKQALNEALDQEMARDPRVIVMGERGRSLPSVARRTRT